MLVLGIESTCDETGIAIVKDGKHILSNVVATQDDLHSRYGGVVPELACRRHVDMCLPLLKKSLQEASLTFQEIDLIAVAHSPGLIGALLIGLHFAKGLALASGKPLVGVNHVEAHLYSALMEVEIVLPAMGVVLSGGHTALILVKDIGDYELIGQTQDDAIGEAFDKVGSLLGLPYPGGPHVEQLAKGGNPKRYHFKPGCMKNRPFDFSFSGLKTAVLYLVKGQNAQKSAPLAIREEDKKDVAASFQFRAFSDIVNKANRAARKFDCKSLLLGGGVSQNQYLRHLFAKEAACPLFWPPKGLCLDNGAMIAGLGYHNYLRQGSDSISLQEMTKLRLQNDQIPTSSSPIFTSS